MHYILSERTQNLHQSAVSGKLKTKKRIEKTLEENT